MSKNKMNKDIVPENFTLGLVSVDAIPVIFFGASMVLIGMLFKSFAFTIGALLCLYAGAMKVIWKLIVVLRRKNIWWMFLQMRYVMPLGFLLMIVSLITNRHSIRLEAILAGVLSFPSVLCFAGGVAGMALMMYFAFNLDSSDLKANWIEQLTNGISQMLIFLGLLLILI